MKIQKNTILGAMIQATKKTTMWIIPPEGPIQEREIDACPEYAEIRDIVGGTIEIVRVIVDGIETELICNDNGMLFDLPENPRALSRVEHTDALMPRLYGTVIIFSEPTVI